ncbi:MAG TPA: hypothetical protein VGN54_06590 [Mycobacteriales bacterium]|jgi:hypothetical protein|nr:hypothetical protein [Mycobacteriales bacterium]
MDRPRCSAKGCSAAAVQAIVWNNPKVHTADREKVWLACDAHVERLRAFLALRGFVQYVEPLADRLARGDDL